jgi:hydroxyacylglutathione hydrolase
LLERAAKIDGTMLESAHALYASLQRFAGFPDWLQIWPGHGAGSACGKGISAVPHSSLGYERRFNWAFTAANEDEFVAEVLSGQPEPPAYFAIMKRINRDGPHRRGAIVRPPRLEAGKIAEVIDNGATVVDTRPASVFADHHVPGTINIPLNKSFTTWVGSLVPYESAAYLIIDDNVAERADEAARDLALIGLDGVAGYFGMDAISAWQSTGRPLETIPQVDVKSVATDAGALVIDVRNASEWEAGHIPGVENIPLATLPERLAELPRDRRTIVHCQTGARSSIAASLLKAHGMIDVSNLAGGFAAWRDRGLPTEEGHPSAASRGR